MSADPYIPEIDNEPFEIKNKYHKSKIYYLFDRNNNRIYVGSTTASFKKRMCDHLYDLRAWEGKRGNKIPRNYRSSFDILIQDEYEKGILENFKCSSKRELEHRETEWIMAFREKNIEVVNKNVPNINTKPVLPHQFFPLPSPS